VEHALQASSQQHKLNFSLSQFLATVKEVQSLRETCLRLTDPEKSLQKIIEKSQTQVSSETLEATLQLLQKSTFLQDIVWFAQSFLKVSEVETLVNASCWIQEPAGDVFLAVGSEIRWLLAVSRCLGLIEMSRLQKLRHAKIRVIGASVAAATVDLLVSLGSEHISCIDPGSIDLSNLPRLPEGKLSSVGQSKSDQLVCQLLAKNPYGHFQSYCARVICQETDRQQKNDVLLDEFIADADIIIEVVDSLKVKVYAQTVALNKKPAVPLIFIADVGNAPIVKVVRSAEGSVELPFGKRSSSFEKELFAHILSTQELALRSEEGTQLLQQLAYITVKDELPPEQAIQYFCWCIGLIPFWSQTPIASRLSAGMAATAVLQELGEQKTLADYLLKEHQPLITSLCEELLNFPKEFP